MVNMAIDIHGSKNTYKDKKKKEIKTDMDKVYEKWGKNLFITYFVCFGDKKRQRKVYIQHNRPITLTLISILKLSKTINQS
jgi:hypothetical protein